MEFGSSFANSLATSLATSLVGPEVSGPYVVTFSCQHGSVGATVDGIGIQSGDEVEAGKTVIFTITPDEHYEYDGPNPESVVVNSNITKAYVCRLQYFAVNFSCTNGTVRAVSEGFEIASGDRVDYGKSVVFTITPDEHYHYVGTNPETVVVTGIVTKDYVCSIDTFSVTATATNGSVSGTGIYNYGSTATLTFIPNDHYHFVQWSDGDTNNPRDIVVTDNVSLTVDGVIDQHSVAVSATNGTAYGQGTYNYGTSVEVGVTPSSGYRFVQWSDGDTNNPRTVVVDGNKSFSTTCQPVPVWTGLKFTAAEVGSTISFNQLDTWGGTWPIEISTDAENWSSYTLGTTITLANVGDYVCFRGQKDGTTQIAGSQRTFNMTGSISASGDITSMLNGTGGVTDLTPYGVGCFMYMFGWCFSLATPPTLSATTLYAECYRGMFQNCTGLTTAPSLPATTLVSSCYQNMFYGCTSLTGPVNITATLPYSSGITSACAGMFSSSGTSRPSTPTDYNKIIVGGNKDDWNSTNCGIDSTYWTVMGYEPLESASYSYNSYGSNKYYYNFDGEYCRVIREAGVGTIAYNLHFTTKDGDTYYLNGTGISYSPPIISNPSATIWTGVLYELV